jgi:hypothetical protein
MAVGVYIQYAGLTRRASLILVTSSISICGGCGDWPQAFDRVERAT